LVAGRLIGNTYVLHYGVDQSLDVKLGLCILSTKERLLGLVDSRLAIANVHIHCVVLEESGISGLILHSGLIGINVFEDIVHKSIDVNAIHFKGDVEVLSVFSPMLGGRTVMSLVMILLIILVIMIEAWEIRVMMRVTRSLMIAILLSPVSILWCMLLRSLL